MTTTNVSIPDAVRERGQSQVRSDRYPNACEDVRAVATKNAPTG